MLHPGWASTQDPPTPNTPGTHETQELSAQGSGGQGPSQSHPASEAMGGAPPNPRGRPPHPRRQLCLRDHSK